MAANYVARALAYQTAVLEGTIPAAAPVILACDRNRRDLERQGTREFPYRFDPDRAARICAMAELLPHIKGPKAFITGADELGRAVWNPIALEPWQCWILTTLFGWVRPEGTRRFRVALLLVPRKNAKSTLAAVVVLYMLVADGEMGAECYSAGTTREQAKTIAEIAWEMARRSPAFCEYYGVKIGSTTTKSLSVPATASKFLALSAEAHTLEGLNISLAAIDELHAHRTAEVYRVLDTATGARVQPLLFCITTAGVDIGGIAHQKLGYLTKILEGTAIDEAFFGINYTIDPGDDVRLEGIRRKANPNYGVSVSPEDLERKITEASHSPAMYNDVLTKHFNIWIRSESPWLSPSVWHACGDPARTMDQYAGYPMWIGVDLAEVRDIAALVALFQLGPDHYAAFGRFFLPAEAVARSPVAELSGWVRQGHILETPGNQADFRRIEAQILEWCETFTVREIDFDRALAAHMQQDLKAHFERLMGRDAADQFVVTVDQTVVTMDPAMKKVERLVLARGLEHDGNPAMTWMIGNIVVERNYKDEIYPRKAGGKDSANKIDGPVALFTCLSRAMRAEPETEPTLFFVGGRS